MLGFATPISLISGFLFGKFYGTLIAVLGFTFGCTLLYILANQYFKDIILKNFQPKYLNLKICLTEIIFIFYDFWVAGGGVAPFAIQNLLPVIFNEN